MDQQTNGTIRGVLGSRRRALATLGLALTLAVAAEATYAMAADNGLETFGIIPALAVFSVLMGIALGVQRAQEGGTISNAAGQAMPWLVPGLFFAFWLLATHSGG
ncbi:MAG: hypothetical protein ACOC5M_00170 [Chloroflexota bacterium]